MFFDNTQHTVDQRGIFPEKFLSTGVGIKHTLHGTHNTPKQLTALAVRPRNPQKVVSRPIDVKSTGIATQRVASVSDK